MVTTSYSETIAGAVPRHLGLGRRPVPLDPSRMTGLMFVVILHVLIVYGLVHVLAFRAITLPPPPLQVRVLDALKKPEDAAKPPPPKTIEMPPVYVPPPEINVTAAPSPSNSNAIAVTTAKPTASVMPPPAPVAPARVDPTLDVSRSTDPAYPPLSRRLSEQGLVTLLVLVGTDGSVVDVRLEKSSGFQRLDQAAIDGAKSGCKFRPGMLDGKPAALWYRYQYQFTLS